MSDQLPPPADAAQPVDMPKSRFRWDNVVALVLVLAMFGLAGLGISYLQPKPQPEGRPIGSVGRVQAFAVPMSPAGEGFVVRRGNRQTFALSADKSKGFERIELSSDDIDVAGSPEPDLVLYGWTGGAHCCFTQMLIDGQTGRLLGELELGNSDPTPFLPSDTKGLAKAVVIGVDDVSASRFGTYSESPMARIVVAWDGKRFALDQKRMKATTPTSPPAFYTNEPELAEATTLGVQDFGIDEETPAKAAPKSNMTSGRGDRAKSYQAWMDGEEARMRQTVLDPEDVSTFGPMAAYLNERVYKGQALDGIATVMAAYEANPQVRDAALAYYLDMLRQSRWFKDLDTLNRGQLTITLDKLRQAPARPE